MRAADEVEVVLGQELGDLVGAEGEGDAAVVVAPAGEIGRASCRERVFVGV